MLNTPNKKVVWLAAGLAGLQLLAGCKKQGGGPLAGGGFPPMQVIAVEAVRQPVTESLSLVGSMAANEMVEIKSETDGIIQEIPFHEGQRVEKGQLLLRLDETKLAAALNEAESNFKLSQANFDRAKQLAQDKLISQSEYDQAAATFALNQATVELRRRELKDARVYAPFNGTIGARNVSPGQVISRSTVLTWLVDLEKVKVEINVPERFIGQLRVGQDLELKVAAFPGQTFTGKVYFVAPLVEASTRTALVKAEIPNADHTLKPGMFANLDLTLRVRENAVVIPEAALSQVLDDNRASVFVVGTNDTVFIKPVRIGVRLPGRLEVIEGLDGGEKVVVEGVQKIGPGSKVKLAPPEAAKPYSGK